MLQRVISIFIVLMSTTHHVWTQGNALKYSRNLTTSDGLAHDGVTSVIMDTHGFMWFGTYDGLSRYDGLNFKTFKNSDDRKYFTSNRVRALAEDTNGNLWVGTDQGLSVFEYELEQFRDIYSKKFATGRNGPILRKLIVDKINDLIVGATEGDGVMVFDLSYTLIGHYYPDSELKQEQIHFHDGLILDNHYVLLSSSTGLWLFNSKTGSFISVLSDEIIDSNFILQLEPGQILATTSRGVVSVEYENSDHGVYSFHLKSRLVKQHPFTSLSKDVQGNVWLGTANEGILRYKSADDLMNGRNENLSGFSDEDIELRVSSIFSTRDLGTWVGTFNHGVYQFDHRENPFKRNQSLVRDPHPPRSTRINRTVTYKDNLAFVTTFRGGLGLFNTAKDDFEILPFPFPAGYRAVYVDSQLDIWLEKKGRELAILRKGASQVEKIDIKGLGSSRSLKRIIIGEGRGADMWISTADNVYRLSLDANRKVLDVEPLDDHPFFRNKSISSIRILYVDPKLDCVWFGTDADGLFRISRLDQTLINCQVDQYTRETNNQYSISSNSVTAIIRATDGSMWIGTERGGMCKLINSEQKIPKFERITEQHGLSNNVVKSMLPDQKGNLWIATNVGLNKLDVRRGVIRRFGIVDGLPFEGFGYSSTVLDNGVLLFSGVSGFCYFNPSDVPDTEPLPRLEFGALRIFGKLIQPNDTIHERVLLDKRLGDLNEIVLKHNEDVFSIDLVSLHYANPENHFIRYQLLPINQEWIQVPSDQQSIYYNGLHPGKYTLRVTASNSLHEWTDPKELGITVLPPWWQTGLAYGVYLFVSIGLGYIVIRIVLRIQSLKHKVELEHLEVETAKKVNDAKLRYFSNISHEIKTPLTLITGPVDFVVSHLQAGELKEKLKIVQRQSKKISQLVDQVHDFQRADANLLKMNLSHFYFDKLIEELVLDFHFMALHDNKTLKIDKTGEPIFVCADKDKLEKIITNLVGNAFKFTSANDVINVSYHRDNRNLHIRIADTGRGIHEDDLPHIFERFYRSQEKQSSYIGGSGIGLAFAKSLVEMHYGYIEVESEIEKGTVFHLRMPIAADESKQSQWEQHVLIKEQTAEPIEYSSDFLDTSDIAVDTTFSEAKIFFVEDNTELRLFISDLLSRFFQVQYFRNGQECMAAMEDEWPDLIVSDVLMPELNGFDFCKAIKSDIKTCHIPIILLTACSEIKDQIVGVQVGADAYIQKPFNAQHLVARIESLLAGRKRLQERFQLDIPLTNRASGGMSHRDMAFLDKLYDLISDNLSNEYLDVDSFSKELCLSRSQLYRKVKTLTGLTPLDLLKNYRIKKAAELLMQGELSVNEVYLNTGFKSRTHFSKTFKESYGVSPGKYASTPNQV